MERAFITLGDRTSHGGTVISADRTFDIHGKFVARVGDMTVCPRCGGHYPITGGAEDMTVFGQPIARDGDRTACGAVLIASQFLARWSDATALAAEAAGASVAAMPSGPAGAASSLCLECLAKAAVGGQAVLPQEEAMAAHA